jgi:hypothetical protein
MESKLLLVVKGAKQFFFLNMVLALVKAELYPDQAELMKQTIIDRIGHVAYSLLMRNVDGQSQDGVNDIDRIEAVSFPPFCPPLSHTHLRSTTN